MITSPLLYRRSIISLSLLLSSFTHAQSTLENGTRNTGQISPASPQEEWFISANKGERVILLLSETTGGTGFTPQLEIINPTGTLFGVHSGPLAARQDFQAAESGAYRVRISDQNGNGAGSYQIEMAQVPSPFTIPNGDEGGALSDGEVHSGDIDFGDLDRWTITATKGDRVTLQLAETAGGVQFKPQMEVFSPSGHLINHSSDSLANRLDFHAGESGDYTIIVSDADNFGFGSYNLFPAQMPTEATIPAGDEGGALSNGESHLGSITLGDLDQWTISASAGQHLILQLTETAGGPSFTPRIEVIDPQGRLLETSSDSLLARLDFHATVSGDYTVLVYGNNPSDLGSYSLQLAQTPATFSTPAGDEGGTLSSATPVTGSIPIGDLDLWTIDATQGDLLTLKLDETAGAAVFTPQLELFSPSGRLLGSGTDSLTVSLSHAVAESGTFLAVVRNSIALGTGDYSLTLTKGTFADISGDTLVNGSQHIGEISVSEEIDRWKFIANIGDSVVIRVGDGSSPSELDPLLKVFAPDESLVEDDSGSKVSGISFRATQAGTYLVTIADSALGSVSDGGRDTGSYKVHLAKTSGSLSISPGDEGGDLVNGFNHRSALDVGDLDIWRFSANEGDSFVVRMGDGPSESEVDPLIWIYNPDGSFIDDSSANRTAGVSAQATQSGVFTVISFDSSLGSVTDGGGDEGSYTIHLAKTSDPLSISPGDEGGELVNGFNHLAGLDTGDLDVWRFFANEGESFDIKMGDGPSASEVDPFIRVYNPDGSPLDDSRGDRSTGVSGRATEGGEFTVVVFDSSLGSVTDGGGDAGTYGIHLAKTMAPLSIAPGDEGGELINGFNHVAAFTTGDLDIWRFTANEGESFAVKIGDGQSPSDVDPFIRIYNPDGSRVEDSSGARAAIVSGRANQSGVFTVAVFDSSLGSVTDGGGDSGTYAIHLAKTWDSITIAPGDEGGTLVNGALHLAAFDTGDLDIWRFTANEGDSIVVRMGDGPADSEVDPLVWVYNPDGSLFADSRNTKAAGVSGQVTQTGEFTVVVFDSSLGSITDGGGDAGPYTLNIAIAPEKFVISNGDNGGPLPRSGDTIGEIFTGDLDHWGFFATEGDDLSFTVSRSSGDLTPWIKIIDPDGILISNSARSPGVTVSFSVEKTGAYQLVISDGSNGIGGAGGYTISSSGLPSQTEPLHVSVDLSPSEPTVTLDWYCFESGLEFILQENATLDPNNWTDSPAPVITDGLNYSTSIPLVEPKNFFRLIPASNE